MARKRQKKSSRTWVVTADPGLDGHPRMPPPSPWVFGLREAIDGEDLIAVGADLAPGTLLAAYRAGLFPMGVGEGGAPPLGWWSPDPRGILGPGDLHVSRSMRRSLGSFDIRIDTAFAEVVAGCADERRPGRWITASIANAYVRLHHLGWAHSVETWRGGELVGGLYGVSVGGLFAGESMFHRVDDASKAALVGLVRHLDGGPSPWLIDVQWRTDHLSTLGVRDVGRTAYLDLIAPLLGQPHRWPGARQLLPSAVQGSPTG